MREEVIFCSKHDVIVLKFPDRLEESYHIALNHFDEIIGPEIVAITPALENPFSSIILNLLPSLMDLQDETVRRDPFLFVNSYFMSYNLMFSLPRMDARGGTDDFMITILITPTETAGMIALSGLRDILPTLRESVVPILVNYFTHGDANKLVIDCENVLKGYLEPINLYIESQREVWGKPVFKSQDYKIE